MTSTQTDLLLLSLVAYVAAEPATHVRALPMPLLRVADVAVERRLLHRTRDVLTLSPDGFDRLALAVEM
jgi:hypothetical protein